MSFPLFPLREDPSGLRPTSKAASGDQQQSAGAWKREMEQAQRHSWFKPGQAAAPADGRPEGTAGRAPLNPGRPHPVSPGDEAKADRMTGQAPANPNAMLRRPLAMPAPALAVACPPRPETGRLPVMDIRLAGLALALAGASRLKVMGLKPPTDAGELAAEALDAPAPPSPHSEEPDTNPQAIRLHAEWHGPEVTVWLGIDAQADAAQAQVAQLLPQIRACLEEQRSRLTKLVCNGKTVFDASSFPVSRFSYFTQSKEFP